MANTNIALGAQSPMGGAMDRYLKAVQIKRAQDASQMDDMQMQDYQKDREFAEQDRQNTKSNNDFTRAIKQIEAVEKIAPLAKDENTYQQVKEMLKPILGVDAVAKMPPNYDPTWIGTQMGDLNKIKSQLPASIQEYEYLTNLQAEDAKDGGKRAETWMLNRRAPKYLDVQSGYVMANQLDPTQTTNVVDKGLTTEQQQDKEKRETAVSKMQEYKSAYANNVILKIADAKAKVSKTTTGLLGVAGSKIPALPGMGANNAYNLRQDIETIKANIGFDKLQQMREASPTGGALGQVAVQELNALQNSIASLDQGQDDATLLKHLTDVETHYNNFLGTMEKINSGQDAPTQEQPPEGAKQAPDGNYYVPNPQGGWLQWQP